MEINEQKIKELREEYQKILELKKGAGLELLERIEELKALESRILGATRKLKELEIFSKRIESEYESKFSYRKGLVEQVEMDNREAEIARRNKEVILGANMDLISEANRDLEDLKKQKEYFVKSLEVREADILNKQKLSEEIGEELKIKAGVAESARKIYEALANETEKKEKELQDKIEEEDKKIGIIEENRKESEKILKNNQKEKNRISDVLKKIAEMKAEVEKDSKWAKIRIEEAQRMFESIGREKELINKERLHLYSQQESLRLAYEEVKKLKQK